MKLYATHATDKKTVEVYDDNGRAFIRRIEGGKVTEWHGVDRTAAQWVSIQAKPAKFTIAS